MRNYVNNIRPLVVRYCFTFVQLIDGSIFLFVYIDLPDTSMCPRLFK